MSYLNSQAKDGAGSLARASIVANEVKGALRHDRPRSDTFMIDHASSRRLFGRYQ